MKVFIDANILVTLLNREYPLFPSAAKLVSLSSTRDIDIFTSPICLAIAFYFATKKSGEVLAKKKISVLSQHLKIAEVNRLVVQQALQNRQVVDFEDGLENFSAQQADCSHLITENIDDFYFSDLQVMTTEDFLKSL